MQLNNFVTKETLVRLQKFGHKVSKMAQELLAAPDAIKLKEFTETRNVYEKEVKHFFDLTVKAAEVAVTALPAVALVVKGGNQANSDHSEKTTKDDSNIVIEGSLASELSKIDYVYEKGTSKGSKAQSINKTSKKDLLDQYVAVLRRILYWTGKSANEAEAIIDVKLSEKGVSGYVKSRRKSNHVYRPVVFK
jgi:hypothetical protein